MTRKQRRGLAQDVVRFVEKFPGRDYRAVGEGIKCEAVLAQATLSSLARTGKLDRVKARGAGARSSYHYYPVAAVAPPAPVLVPTPEPVEQSTGTVQTVSAAISQLVSAVVEEFEQQLAAKLAEAIVAGGTVLDTSALMERLRQKPVMPATTEARLPRVGIVGLLPSQCGIISSEFHDVMDLRFWVQGDSVESLRTMAKGCDIVFTHTKHMSHKDEEVLQASGATLRRVSGGVTSLKDALEAYFVEGK